MRWLWTRIQVRIETVALLDVEIEEARGTLARLETGTWGVVLREIGGERFVVLSAGTLDRPRSACREAVERVRRLYDRVGTATGGGL